MPRLTLSRGTKLGVGALDAGLARPGTIIWLWGRYEEAAVLNRTWEWGIGFNQGQKRHLG